MAEILQRILIKLQTNESTISRLFQGQGSIPPLMDQSLIELEQIILNIPSDDYVLIENWRDTMMMLCNQLMLQTERCSIPMRNDPVKSSNISSTWKSTKQSFAEYDLMEKCSSQLPSSLDISHEVDRFRSSQREILSQEISTIFERILRKLCTTESIINTMSKMHTKSETTLKAKLCEIERLITDDSKDCENGWIDEWRDRVLILWTKYSTSVNDHSLSKENKQNLSASISQNQLSLDQNNNAIIASTTLKKTSKFQFPARNDLVDPSDEFYFPLSPEHIRDTLQYNFGKIDHVENMLELEQLIEELIHAENIIAAHFDDVYLQSEVLYSAVSQLPPNIVKQFAAFLLQRNAQFAIKLPTIEHLQLFLRNKIANSYDQVNVLYDHRIGNSHHAPNNELKVEDRCVCCTTSDHYTDQCSKLAEMICFKCFQFDHVAATCWVVPNLCRNCGKDGHLSKALSSSKCCTQTIDSVITTILDDTYDWAAPPLDDPNYPNIYLPSEPSYSAQMPEIVRSEESPLIKYPAESTLNTRSETASARVGRFGKILSPSYSVEVSSDMPNVSTNLNDTTKLSESENEACKSKTFKVKVLITNITLRSTVKKAFAALAQVRAIAHIESMKILLVLVTKTGELIAPYQHDSVLQEDSYSYGFNKLPPELQEVYMDCSTAGRVTCTLPDLQAFIQTELLDYAQQMYLVGLNANFCNEQNEKEREQFHLTVTICTRCFQFGHSPKLCANLVKNQLEDLLA